MAYRKVYIEKEIGSEIKIGKTLMLKYIMCIQHWELRAEVFH